MLSNFEILAIVASFYVIDCHNVYMLTFIILSSISVIALHKFVMNSVNGYDSYGSHTAKQEWINFEREKLGF